VKKDGMFGLVVSSFLYTAISASSLSTLFVVKSFD
jgi:hypothetical protein